MSGTFDGGGQHSLVFGAISRNPAGNDLASLGHKMAQFFIVLVVDLGGFFQTKLAVLAMEHSAFLGIAGIVLCFSF